MLVEPPPLPVLPPYTGPTTRCPKCTNVEASMKWYDDRSVCIHAPDDSYIMSTWDMHEMRSIERMHRECTRCGYVWDEAINEPATLGVPAA